MSESHYSVLQVAPNACREVIVAAHKALMRLHHPDAGGDAALAQRLNEARDVLLDTEKRASYDLALAKARLHYVGATPTREHDIARAAADAASKIAEAMKHRSAKPAQSFVVVDRAARTYHAPTCRSGFKRDKLMSLGAALKQGFRQHRECGASVA